MREREIPEWVARVGAELRSRSEKLPVNEPYLVEVTELLRAICEGRVSLRTASCRSSDDRVALSKHPANRAADVVKVGVDVARVVAVVLADPRPENRTRKWPLKSGA